MDEFERELARRLSDCDANDGGAEGYEGAIAEARHWRVVRRWATGLSGLVTTGVVLTLGFGLAVRVLPTPDSLLSAVLWAPLAAVALLVLAALHELLRGLP